MTCPLTDKHLDVIRWLAEGKTAGEISEILSIKKYNVYERVKIALKLTGAANSTGLVAMCLRRGWIK